MITVIVLAVTFGALILLGVPRKTIREHHAPTNELIATTLADLSVLASSPSWRGFTSHSIVIVAIHRCSPQQRTVSMAVSSSGAGM